MKFGNRFLTAMGSGCLISNMGSESGPQEVKMKVVTIAAPKGGSCKTTTACLLAVERCRTRRTFA